MTKKSRTKPMWSKLASLLILTAGVMNTSLGEAKEKSKPKSKSTSDYKPLPFTYEKLMEKRLKSEFPNVVAATDSFEMRKSAAGTATLNITKNKNGKLTYLNLAILNRESQWGPNFDSAAFFIEAVTGSPEEGLDFYQACFDKLKSKGNSELVKQHNGFIVKCWGPGWARPNIEVRVEDSK